MTNNDQLVGLWSAGVQLPVHRTSRSTTLNPPPLALNPPPLALNPQVCSYRCIVSYESPLFEKFSLCNLQKHNCLQNFAERPALPDVQPMPTFRG